MLALKRFGFSHAGFSNMEDKSIKYNLAPTLWWCLFSLDHIMCTEAQQQNDHWGCHHGCWHIPSTNTWTLVLPLPKTIVGDNSCKTGDYYAFHLCDTKVVSTEHKFFHAHYISYISPVCAKTPRLYSEYQTLYIYFRISHYIYFYLFFIFILFIINKVHPYLAIC